MVGAIGRLTFLCAMLVGLVGWNPQPAMADHESVGVVVWAGEGEVVLLSEGHLHVLEVTPETVLLDDAGRPTRRVGVGDTVRERCAPAPHGEFSALRIEVLRAAWRWVEAAVV